MKIAYQGEPGANSHIACRDVHPELEPLPCASFEDALTAISDGTATLGMIPIENSLAGRVADIHHFLPTAGLHIVGEYFLPIHFQLVALPGQRIEAYLMNPGPWNMVGLMVAGVVALKLVADRITRRAP